MVNTLKPFNTLRPRQNGHHLPEDFSNACSWMEMLTFWLKFKCSVCYWRSNRQLSCIGLDNGLAPKRWQASILTSNVLGYWRIYIVTQPRWTNCILKRTKLVVQGLFGWYSWFYMPGLSFCTPKFLLLSNNDIWFSVLIGICWKNWRIQQIRHHFKGKNVTKLLRLSLKFHLNILCLTNRPISQIPECTCSLTHKAAFRTEMCTFVNWMEHCGIWNGCILGFANWLGASNVLATIWNWLSTALSNKDPDYFMP